MVIASDLSGLKDLTGQTGQKQITTPMHRKIITTADGSHSLYVEGLDENYHSKHGAIQESLHVFIKMGLQHLHEKGMKKIALLEVGFGTGLNALLTMMEAEKLGFEVHYSGLEAFPLEKEILSELNYVSELRKIPPFGEVHAARSQSAPGDAGDDIRTKFDQLHSAEWEKEIKLSDSFYLHKIKSNLQDVILPSKYDLIYFDAFGPRVQPEMWTNEIFSKIFGTTNPGGILVTYCSKGDARRSMMKAGFKVEKPAGPPGKRDMVRATKPAS